MSLLANGSKLLAAAVRHIAVLVIVAAGFQLHR
jgi:hypothetical protein